MLSSRGCRKAHGMEAAIGVDTTGWTTRAQSVCAGVHVLESMVLWAKQGAEQGSRAQPPSATHGPRPT